MQYVFSVAVLLLVFSGLTQAASLTSSGYSQNFDSMGTAGTTLPADWSIWKVGTSHSAWATSITANGAADSVSAMTSAGTSLVSALLDSGITTSTKNANAYNIAHAATPNDRVLTTSPTGVDGSAIQLSLTNNTGSALSNLAISYDIVKFYDGNKQSTIDSTFPAGEELPGYELFYSVNGGSWANVAVLNPVNTSDGIHPVIPVGAINANGVNGPVDYSVTSISNAVVSLGTSWGAGQTLSLRWVDDNAVNISADQIIGLNNVSVSAVPEAGTYAMFLAGLGLIGCVTRRRNRR